MAKLAMWLLLALPVTQLLEGFNLWLVSCVNHLLTLGSYQGIPWVVMILRRLAIGDFVKLFCESVVAFSGSAAGVDLPNLFDVQRSVVVRTRFGALQITPSIFVITN